MGSKRKLKEEIDGRNWERNSLGKEKYKTSVEGAAENARGP